MSVRDPGRRRPAVSGWRNVATKELADTWLGGRAAILLILFSLLLSMMAYLLATNGSLKLSLPEESVYLMLQATLAVGLFIGLIAGADAISGERERATLESLLLTPTSRHQIAVGKFLAAISPWPAALAISAPYIDAIAPKDETLIRAMLWGGITGTLLVLGFTAFGMLLSLWTNSNRTSITIGLVSYLLLILPTQFTGGAQSGPVGIFIKRINPLEATNQFLEKIIVNNRTPGEMRSWLLAPAIFALLALAVLVVRAGPDLRLEAPKRRRLNLPFLARAGTAALLATVILFVLGRQPAFAETAPARAAQASGWLTVSVNVKARKARSGDSIPFMTVITNDGSTRSPKLVAAMNIINLGSGDPVDPEDWSEERTQYMDPLAPGQSRTLEWNVNAILDGNYLVYIVAVPQPAGPGTTAQPAASSGIHLTIEKHLQVNPGGVTPIAIAMPAGLSLLALGLVLVRRRRVETGGG